MCKRQIAQSAHYIILNADAAKLVVANSIDSDRVTMANAMYEDLVTNLRPRVASTKTATKMLYPYDATVAPDPAGIDAIYTSALMPDSKRRRIDACRRLIMYDQSAAVQDSSNNFRNPQVK